MHKSQAVGIFCVFCVSVLLVGCVHAAQRGDATSVQSLSTDLNSADLQMVSDRMVDSILSFPPMVETTRQRRPAIIVDSIKNRTQQHLDSQAITDAIKVKLIQSGKFRFVDRATGLKMMSELVNQQHSGGTNSYKTMPLEQPEAAEYVLTGAVSEIDQRVGDKQEVSYKFTFSLLNIQTHIVLWADQYEIHKIMTHPRERL
jgi:uncharacterized protein (TIGR02722 family)